MRPPESCPMRIIQKVREIAVIRIPEIFNRIQCILVNYHILTIPPPPPPPLRSWILLEERGALSGPLKDESSSGTSRSGEPCPESLLVLMVHRSAGCA